MSNSGAPLQILGMMSGTSVDSIDVALCGIQEGENGRLMAQLLGFYEHPIPDRLRARIFRLFKNGPGSLSLACSLNFEIGEAFAEAALTFLNRERIDARGIDAIASHGQTVWHTAPHMVRGEAGGEESTASTLQIGEAAVIAERTQIPVVSDFRTADMAAGGNGAPLVPFADWHLFSRPDANVVVLNIGGIANLTYLPASGDMEEVIAFDTGPGNMIIDALVKCFHGRPYDDEGKYARQGRVLPDLLGEWMSVPYISAPPPKSTGRELFGVQFAENAAERHKAASPEDLIATATEFTVRSLVQNVAEHVGPKGELAEILVAGGGAKNPWLMERISEECRTSAALSRTKVRLLDETGFPSKARECIAFALLGYARLQNMPANVPSATGASRRVLLGKLTAVET